MKFDKSKFVDVLKLFLFEWFFISLIFLFIFGVTGIMIALVISIILTIITTVLYHASWQNLRNQLPHW